MAENKKMSTAEILAAARAAKAAKSEAAEAAPPAVVTDTPAPKAAAPKPAAAKPAGAAGGRPSVAEIMALARAKKEAEQGGSPAVPADQPAPKSAAAKAPVAKPPADKPAVTKAAAQKSLTRDTASILAAARTGAKPGPVSKADAPARPAAVAEPASTVVKAAPAKLVTAPVLPPKPVKPVAKKGADAEQDRRGFLELALGSFMATGFTALSMTGGLFGLGLARFMFPNVLAEPPSRFKVGFREGFPSGKVETKYVAQYGVWVVNSDVGGQQQIYALKTVCTHLGCTPNWLEAEQKFKCPCHGSGFYKDGVNFEGPAPRPLERYAIRIADDGQLEIDKGRSYHEELGQWADPESFITV
jgi:cytochrome b6-f complex iron-sulfur subunit